MVVRGRVELPTFRFSGAQPSKALANPGPVLTIQTAGPVKLQGRLMHRTFVMHAGSKPGGPRPSGTERRLLALHLHIGRLRCASGVRIRLGGRVVLRLADLAVIFGASASALLAQRGVTVALRRWSHGLGQ